MRAEGVHNFPKRILTLIPPQFLVIPPRRAAPRRGISTEPFILKGAMLFQLWAAMLGRVW